MKNLILASVFMLLVLPKASFGANTPVVPAVVNPQAHVCEPQLSGESNAFFQAQGAERLAFLKANPGIIAAHDLRFQENHAIAVARLFGRPTAGLPVPPDENPAFTSFFQKQLGDKQAFLGKLARDKQNCYNGQPITLTTGVSN